MSKIFSIMLLVLLASCSSHRLAPFSGQHWHVDTYSGNAVSDRGMELGFGSEWMIVDTALIQTPRQLVSYPKLEKHLAKSIAEFPEIAVDSILFYNPARGLLFTTYNQAKPLKPTSELYLVSDTVQYYSKEYAGIFGQITTWIDDDGWEEGPEKSVYTNVRYSPGKKQLVLLQRIPYKGRGVAIFRICKTTPKRGRWWEEYPRGTFRSVDLGNTNNIESLALFLQAARTTGVINLKLGTETK